MLATSSTGITLDASIFRAYDIRGIVGESLTEEFVFLIGKALGSLVLDSGENQIAVARDGRLSGSVLSAALCKGILSVGCNVMDVGMVPTPLLYYATNILDQHSGVMLTGSHNPANYNGLKMVLKGKALTSSEITGLYQRIVNKQFHVGQGLLSHMDVVASYIHEVASNIKLARPLKVVLDSGNGVAGMMAAKLFKALGCEVHELFCEVDGHFPNHHPDPSQIENLHDLIQAVQETQADVGLAFDGDGDRLGVITNKGEIIWPDRLLMLYAKALLAEKPSAKIIYDVKCTNELEKLIRVCHGTPVMWKTGHSFIKSKMIEIQAELAGEMSGHFFFKDRWYGFDDGLYAGARLVEILSEQSEDSATVFAAIPNSVNTPELKVLVAEEEKFQLMEKLISAARFSDPHEVMTIDGLRVNFSDGWGLVRPSNTTPYLILRFEALNDGMLKRIQQMFREWMLSVKPDLVLPF
jgi:phosphomannomutase/phosphoglucomutase